MTAYTVFCNDKLARESSPNLVGMKIPVGSSDGSANEANIRRWTEARLSWERGRIHMEVIRRDVEHRPIHANEAGRAAAACRLRSSADEHETKWFFEPATR